MLSKANGLECRESGALRASRVLQSSFAAEIVEHRRKTPVLLRCNLGEEEGGPFSLGKQDPSLPATMSEVPGTGLSRVRTDISISISGTSWALTGWKRGSNKAARIAMAPTP